MSDYYQRDALDRVAVKKGDSASDKRAELDRRLERLAGKASSGKARKHTDVRPRCANPNCGLKPGDPGRVLAEELTRPWTVVCPRCGWSNQKTLEEL